MYTAAEVMDCIDERRDVEIAKYVEVYAHKPDYGSHGEGLREIIRRLLAKCEHKGTLLDVSCGRGAAMQLARDAGFKSVRGTEVVEQLLNDDVEYAQIHDLPFDDNSFDVVLNTGVLEHLVPADTRPAIDEMCRVAVFDVLITLNNDPGYYHVNTLDSYDSWTRMLELCVPQGWTVNYLNDVGIEGKNKAWHLTR